MADSMAHGAKEFGRGIFQGVTGVVMEVIFAVTVFLQCLQQLYRLTIERLEVGTWSADAIQMLSDSDFNRPT